jgi:hypothetical protein
MILNNERDIPPQAGFRLGEILEVVMEERGKPNV